MSDYDAELKDFLSWWRREGSRPIPNNEALVWQHSAPLRAFDAWRASAKKDRGPRTPIDALRIAVPLMRRKGYSVEANHLEIFIADIVERLETPARHP